MHWVSKKIADDINEEAMNKYRRLETSLSQYVGGGWLTDVDAQLSSFLNGRVAQKAQSRSACSKCRSLSQVARITLEEESIRPMPIFSAMLASLGLPCIGVEDLMLGDFNGANPSPGVSPIVAGRAMQVVGIRACRARGKAAFECYCVRDVYRNEGDQRLKRLIELGSSNWEGLSKLELAA